MENGEIVGRVTDVPGDPLPGVVVAAISDASGAWSTVTNAAGEYILRGLQPGSYTVTFEMPGFTPAEKKGVEVRAGQPTECDAVLQIAEVTEE